MKRRLPFDLPTRRQASSPRAHAHGAIALEQRRSAIFEMVEKSGRVTTEELARRFHTSLVTARADLNALAETGRVVRTHGGALAQREVEETPIDVKQGLRSGEKLRIARVAAGMIRDGQTVLLDSGSTTGEIARQVRGMALTSINVITNALNIAVALAGVPFVQLVMIGGILRPNSYSMSGPQAELAMRGFQADVLFLGVDSLDVDVGLMTPHVLEAQLNAQMIRCARRVVAVADSSKLLRRNLSVIARVEAIHTLVTDDAASPAVVDALRARGVEVIVVPADDA